MKKLLLTAALLIAFARVQADHELSELHLRLFDRTQFTVVLDGNQFNTSTELFDISGITPGFHQLTVIRRPFASHGQFAAHHGTVIYNGRIEIPAQASVNALIDRYYRFRIYSVNALYIEPGCQAPPPLGFNQAPVYTGMHPEDFEQLRRTIMQRSFDSSKLQIAKQAIDANYMTSRQIGELMRLLTFDSYKLDLAKFAYCKVVDKNNFWIVNDAFTFESSIRDLNYFISHG
ncbi:MAG TPA: DUF4476 domain-containing protein [Bacteroidia bacterium]|nr:DUF4476 domain-containing protein [Bacteroidia bacterium]